MNKYNIFLIFFFLFFLIFSFFTRYSYADTPTPTPTNAPGCSPQGGDCESTGCCFSDPSSHNQLFCVKTSPVGEHGYVCESCTKKLGDSCTPFSSDCCIGSLSCVAQSGGTSSCVDLTNQPTFTLQNPCPNGLCSTAIGPVPTDVSGFIGILFRTILSLSGGVAILMIVLGGYRLTVSQGNPEKVQQAREIITSAIVGLLFIIFSVTLLQIIGIDVLGLPGFSK